MSGGKPYFCSVKELVRHIEILLSDNDCVVVPQIGAFVTRNVPAKYIEEENLFLPPIRTVGFNEQLKADDGLLTASYVAAYECPEAEARRMLGEQVRDLQQELWESGVYDLGSIGVLSLDERNTIRFSPCQAGTVCPSYYGLDALLFPPLPIEAGTALPQPAAESPVPPQEATLPAQERNEYTIRVKKSWVQNIAAVAAVVLLFFLMSPDAKNTALDNRQQADFTQLLLMPAAYERVPETAMSPLPSQDAAAADMKVAENTEEPETAEAEKPADEGTAVKSGYCVVVASAISEKNAESYVKRLHKAGYEDAQVYKKGRMVRVVFPGYATDAEAHARMNELSDRSEEFATAWVYHIK